MSLIFRGDGMQSINIEVRDVWIELQGTEHGCLLQTERGEVVYYTYSDYPPDKYATGYPEDAVGGPSKLRGGRIWIRSKNWSIVSFTPYDVDNELNLEDDLKAQIELKADKADVGDIVNLTTSVKTSIVNSINSLKTAIDNISGNMIWSGEVILTNDMITNKRIILPSVPNGIVFFNPYGGIPQRMNQDFVVNTNILSWDSLALELLLEVGEAVYIQYQSEI